MVRRALNEKVLKRKSSPAKDLISSLHGTKRMQITK